MPPAVARHPWSTSSRCDDRRATRAGAPRHCAQHLECLTPAPVDVIDDDEPRSTRIRSRFIGKSSLADSRRAGEHKKFAGAGGRAIDEALDTTRHLGVQ